MAEMEDVESLPGLYLEARDTRIDHCPDRALQIYPPSKNVHFFYSTPFHYNFYKLFKQKGRVGGWQQKQMSKEQQC